MVDLLELNSACAFTQIMYVLLGKIAGKLHHDDTDCLMAPQLHTFKSQKKKKESGTSTT